MTLFLLFFDYCASKQCSKNSIALYLSGPIQVSPKNCVRNWRLSKTSFKRKFDPCGKRNSSHYTVFYPGNFFKSSKIPKICLSGQNIPNYIWRENSNLFAL